MKKAESEKRWRDKKRQEADRVFGTACFLCKGIVRPGLHKKDGEEHQTWCTAVEALKEPEKWVRLCYPCHKAVHWCMEHLGLTWEQIVEIYH